MLEELLRDVFKVLHDREMINKLLRSFYQYHSDVKEMELGMVEENPYLLLT